MAGRDQCWSASWAGYVLHGRVNSPMGNPYCEHPTRQRRALFGTTVADQPEEQLWPPELFKYTGRNLYYTAAYQRSENTPTGTFLCSVDFWSTLRVKRFRPCTYGRADSSGCFVCLLWFVRLYCRADADCGHVIHSVEELENVFIRTSGRRRDLRKRVSATVCPMSDRRGHPVCYALNQGAALAEKGRTRRSLLLCALWTWTLKIYQRQLWTWAAISR